VQAREFGHPYQEGGETDPGPGGSELCVGAAEVVKEEEGHKERVNLLKRAFDLRVHFWQQTGYRPAFERGASPPSSFSRPAEGGPEGYLLVFIYFCISVFL
jgi:hypothetical protein